MTGAPAAVSLPELAALVFAALVVTDRVLAWLLPEVAPVFHLARKEVTPEGEVRLYAALDSVHLDPANANDHPERNLAAIRASLAQYGQQTPIVLNARGVVVKGNGTTMAARALGWPDIWFVRTDLAGVDLVGYGIADNQTGKLSAWNDAVLAQHLEAIRSEPDFPIEATGFTDADVDALLERVADDAAGDADTEGDSTEVASKFEVVVACSGEAGQRALFERLTAEGYACRVLQS